MADVVWTTRASADLDAIADYYAEMAPGYAESLIRRLLSVTERLESFPASGRIVPEIGDPSMREVIHRNFRIDYLHLEEEDRVEVLSVFHGSRQFGAATGDAE